MNFQVIWGIKLCLLIYYPLELLDLKLDVADVLETSIIANPHSVTSEKTRVFVSMDVTARELMTRTQCYVFPHIYF